MQLPNDVTQKMGNETALYTLLRRHQTVGNDYQTILNEAQLATELKPVVEELIAGHAALRTKAEELLKDFSGSPVKPNEQTVGSESNGAAYPTRFDVPKNVLPYLRDQEEQVMHLYSDIAKRGNFPDSVSNFLTESQQAIMNSVNKLDFKAKT